MTEEPVIRIDNVSKSFLSEEKPVAVLENVSFNVGKEFLCIVGPSGCGKSTLLRMIDGLDRPSQGNVYFHGKPVEGPTPMMGMVFQTFALIPWKTVLENVVSQRTIRRYETKSWNSTSPCFGAGSIANG